MDAFFKFISKPINFVILLSIFITSLLLVFSNFLSPETKDILHLTNFLEEYTGYLVAILTLSFFFIIFQGLSMIITKYKETKFRKNMEEMRINMLDDEVAWEILHHLYKQNGEPVELPYFHATINQLTTLQMIVRMNNQIGIYSEEQLKNPYFQYVLQAPGKALVEKRLRNEI